MIWGSFPTAQRQTFSSSHIENTNKNHHFRTLVSSKPSCHPLTSSFRESEKTTTSVHHCPSTKVIKAIETKATLSERDVGVKAEVCTSKGTIQQAETRAGDVGIKTEKGGELFKDRQINFEIQICQVTFTQYPGMHLSM